MLLQGFVYPDGTSRHAPPTDPDAPLPSLLMSSLKPSLPEVADCFHLPLSAMVTPSRLKIRIFRGQRTYCAIKVSDLVAGSDVRWESDTEIDEVGGGRDLEIWGLTGWYLSLLMKVLHVYR